MQETKVYKDLNVIDCRGLWTRKDGEQGRSMVEMLGTLAIMGVLSAGAIGGYSYAMNKHRTNELIYEATKRAQWVGTQLEMNNPNPSLNTFGTDSFGGGTFDSVLTNLPNNQIGIIVKDLKEAVCDNIKSSIGDNTVIRAIKDESGTGDISCADNITATLVFNRDLSTSDSTASSGTDGEEPQEPEEPAVDPDEANCSGHGEWDGSACTCQSDYTGSDCSEEVEDPKTCSGNGTWTVNPYDESGYCSCDSGWVGSNCSIDSSCSGNGTRDEYGGGCVCNAGYAGANCSEVEKSCVTNDNCDAGYFCKYDNVFGCTAPTAGKCVDAAGYRGGRMSGYVWSNIRLDWWSAKNFCDAQDKSMVNLSSLNCPYTVDQYEANSNEGYCCTTAGSGIGAGCNGNYSSAIATLRGTGAPMDFCWTEDLTNYSCPAFYVNLNDGYVDGNGRINFAYALCR